MTDSQRDRAAPSGEPSEAEMVRKLGEEIRSDVGLVRAAIGDGASINGALNRIIRSVFRAALRATPAEAGGSGASERAIEVAYRLGWQDGRDSHDRPYHGDWWERAGGLRAKAGLGRRAAPERREDRVSRGRPGDEAAVGYWLDQLDLHGDWSEAGRILRASLATAEQRARRVAVGEVRRAIENAFYHPGTEAADCELGRVFLVLDRLESAASPTDPGGRTDGGTDGD